MTAASAISTNRANLRTEAGFGERRRGLRLNSQVMQISRGLWPVKTSAHLADLTGYSTRACEAWMSGHAVLPSDALAALLRSEQGREFLAAVMTDTTPRWWLKLKARLKSIDMAMATKIQNRAFREMLDAEAMAGIAPQHSAALLVQDEDFYSGQAAPPATTARKRR